MRSSGVLMHLSSLPSDYGIGSMGRTAREFVDFLADAGQSYWQLLPICPTSYGDSPYQSFSTFAGNPYFIDLDELCRDGLLLRKEYADVDWESEPDCVNYGALYQKRYAILRLAAARFAQKPDPHFSDFCRRNGDWLEDFALFMALKDAHGGAAWSHWEPKLRTRQPEALAAARQQYAGDVEFWKIVQFLFFRQWDALRAYANEKGVSIIGDMPIYVSLDSADVWAEPKLFQLDGDLSPREVSGCPADGFSADGQLWGNPLFDWDYMAADGYRWWVRRIGYLCGVYNVLRIDHFRGFDSYYAIPNGAQSAKDGHWRKGPGMALFRAVEQAIGKQQIIAEDLGFLTDSVRKLLRDSGFPGMKVLLLAFDGRDDSGHDYLPHNLNACCVAYIGTHDNDTVQGWMASANPEDAAFAKEYLHLTQEEGYHWGMMRGLWSSAAGLTVVQAQDLLGLGSESRMNVPSSVGSNWRWRALPGAFTPELAGRLYRAMEVYDRLPQK